jgi:hypothetical protein
VTEQYLAAGLRTQPMMETPLGTAMHNRKTSVKNRRMNPPRSGSTSRGTVYQKS